MQKLVYPAIFGMACGLLSAPAFAQDASQTTGADGLVDERSISRQTPPAAAPQAPRGFAPLTGRLALNGVSFDVGQEWVLDMGLDGGDSRNTSLTGTVTHVLSNEVNDRLSLGLFSRNQTAWVLQLNSFTQERTVRSTRVEGGDLVGFRLDLSLTGKCLFGPDAGQTPAQYCTYTPGFATIPGAYDPDTLVPTLFSNDSAFGETIPEGTHLSLKELEGGVPVFQRGEGFPGGPLVGVSLDVPNAGFIATEEGRRFNLGARDEDISTRYVASIARIEQNLYSNSAEASADRTTRAFVLLDPEDWDSKNALTQLAGLLLPKMGRPLNADAGAARLGISNNLFFALNNARRPANSFTVFETGFATLRHSATPARSAAETPTARYLGFWMGFSPVRDTTATGRQQFIPVGPRVDFTDPVFAEGGGEIGLDLLNDSSFAVINAFDQSIITVDPNAIDDIFVQLGLSLSTQEAVRRITTTETSRYRYVPHLSFNGNITTGVSVFRYYIGALVDDKTNAYIGADYTYTTENGWSAYARGEVYSNPDSDYRNEIEGRVSRTFQINPTRSITLGAGGVVVLRDVSVGSDRNAELGEAADRFDLVGRWREGPLDFTLRHRITENADDTRAESTTLGVGYATGGRFAVNAQYTPSSSENAYIEALAGVSWRIAEPLNAPTLRAQIARAKYNVGNDSFGSPLVAEENLFRLALQARF